MAIIKKIISAGKDVEKLDSYTIGGNVKPFWKTI